MKAQFMIKAPLSLWLTLALSVVSSCTAKAQQQEPPKKPIKVILRVEAQGPEGLWMQAGKDLSLAELNQLRSLMIGELEKLPNHKLVASDDKDEDLGLAIVAEKLQCGKDSYILLSSALTIAKVNGTEVFVSHDVIAEPSLTRAAKAVVGHFTSVESRALLGLR